MKEKLTGETILASAQRLHGHLGPFLAIGVRMGIIINTGLPESAEKKITIKVPDQIPFTCAIDGIQAATHCTVGNGRLTILNSHSDIIVQAKTENPKHKIILRTRKEMTAKIMTQIKDHVDLEALAGQIVKATETELFIIEQE